jgi:plastocyanin
MSTRRRLPWALGPTALLVALAAAACFSERSSATGPGPTDCRLDVEVPPGGGVVFLVRIQNFAFEPQTVRVPRGATVAWVNCEPAAAADQPHTTTSDTGAWNSPLLGIGEAFARRFDDAGEFPYHCAPHPAMQGTIIVE